MAQLGLVQRHDHDEEADSNSSKAAPGVKIAQILSTSLQSAAETEDEGSDHDGQSATEHITDGTGKEGAKETTAREDGHDSTAIQNENRAIKVLAERTSHWR